MDSINSDVTINVILQHHDKKILKYCHGTVTISTNISCGSFACKVHGSYQANRYKCILLDLIVIVLLHLKRSGTYCSKRQTRSHKTCPAPPLDCVASLGVFSMLESNCRVAWLLYCFSIVHRPIIHCQKQFTVT